MHPGQGPGLSLHDLGETGGSETVTLLDIGDAGPRPRRARRRPIRPISTAPSPARSLAAIHVRLRLPTRPVGLVAMAPSALAPAGGDQPHNNMMPYLTLNFCIALQGVYPPRT